MYLKKRYSSGRDGNGLGKIVEWQGRSDDGLLILALRKGVSVCKRVCVALRQIYSAECVQSVLYAGYKYDISNSVTRIDTSRMRR